jgi:hypothetical protein
MTVKRLYTFSPLGSIFLCLFVLSLCGCSTQGVPISQKDIESYDCDKDTLFSPEQEKERDERKKELDRMIMKAWGFCIHSPTAHTLIPWPGFFPKEKRLCRAKPL